MGKTNPKDAAPGTIRGDLAQQTGRNIIHGSDSPESAKREIDLFFNDYELQDYKLQRQLLAVRVNDRNIFPKLLPIFFIFCTSEHPSRSSAGAEKDRNRHLP